MIVDQKPEEGFCVSADSDSSIAICKWDLPQNDQPEPCRFVMRRRCWVPNYDPRYLHL